MKKEVLIVGALACALSLPLMGCNSTPAASGNNGGGSSQGETEDFDAVEAYWGQWRGSVEITGESIYGSTSGNEPMLDINLAQDGTCTVEPLASHADLLTDEGTWDGTEGQIVLHLTDGDITITVTGGDTAEANAADFEKINFAFYG